MNQMDLLIKFLEMSNIPFEVTDCWGNPQVCYPSKENCICDAVCHWFSYGGDEGLLEIMGLVEREDDDVEGWLTAEEVFHRIAHHYYTHIKEN